MRAIALRACRKSIENLLDEEPPLTGGNPNGLPFPVGPTHATSSGTSGLGAGGSSVYEPLGRRAFVCLTMDFCWVRSSEEKT